MSVSVYPFERPEFENIRYKAYDLLLNQKNPYIGMNAKDVEIPGKSLVFSTLQEYSKITGVSMSDLTASGKITLGCHVNINDKIYVLLHNEDIYNEKCENWTNIHEIGHIYLSHDTNGDKEEIEAHFFAACFLMPDPVLRALESNGCEISQQLLVEYFNVSTEAANKKLDTLKKGIFRTALDRKITEILNRDIQYIIHDQRKKRFSFINFNAFNL